MKYDVQQETELRRYLLGEMTMEEQVLVEQRLFLDNDYAELQQAVEAELIDDYLHADLSGSEREAFERHFLLQSEHRENLRIAEALKAYLASEVVVSPIEPVPSRTEFQPPKTRLTSELVGSPETDVVSSTPDFVPARTPLVVPFFRKPIVWWSLAAAALFIIAIVTWISVRSLRGPAANEQHQANDPRVPQPAPTEPVERPQPGPFPQNNRNTIETAQNTNQPGTAPKRRERTATLSRIVSATIMPGSPFRGGTTNVKTVTINADTETVVLTLPLRFSEQYETYHAELLSGERIINRWRNLKSETNETHGAHVLVRIDSALLRDQSYRIKVRGIPTEQQAGDTEIYSFNVERK